MVYPWFYFNKFYYLKKVKFIKKIVLSSDSKKILNIAKNKKIDLNLRPKYLATDTASTFSVLKNLLKKPEYKNFKNIICLEPTSPFTNSKIIKKSIQLFLKSKAIIINYNCRSKSI